MKRKFTALMATLLVGISSFGAFAQGFNPANQIQKIEWDDFGRYLLIYLENAPLVFDDNTIYQYLPNFKLEAIDNPEWELDELVYWANYTYMFSVGEGLIGLSLGGTKFTKGDYILTMPAQYYGVEYNGKIYYNDEYEIPITVENRFLEADLMKFTGPEYGVIKLDTRAAQLWFYYIPYTGGEWYPQYSQGNVTVEDEDGIKTILPAKYITDDQMNCLVTFSVGALKLTPGNYTLVVPPGYFFYISFASPDLFNNDSYGTELRYPFTIADDGRDDGLTYNHEVTGPDEFGFITVTWPETDELIPGLAYDEVITVQDLTGERFTYQFDKDVTIEGNSLRINVNSCGLVENMTYTLNIPAEYVWMFIDDEDRNNAPIIYSWNALNADNPTPTPGGVEGVLIDEEDAPVFYYDLQGRRVVNPEKGIYIVKKGNKTHKVVL